MTTMLPAPATAPIRIRRAPKRDNGFSRTFLVAIFGPGPDTAILSCGEMAMALHHARGELRHGLTPTEIATLVLDGVAVLGGVAAVCAQAEASRQLGLAYVRRTEAPDHRQQWRRLWPHGDRRESLARALSLTLADHVR